jgi:hypothetical protein
VSAICISPNKYTKTLVKKNVPFFGDSPKQNVASALEKGDISEFDILDLLYYKGVESFKSIMPSIQMTMLIGFIDIMTAIMTLPGL